MPKNWKYMELEKIQHLPNQGRELLGRYIYWTEKRDGSCLAIHMKEVAGLKAFFNKHLKKRTIRFLVVSSRHMEKAEDSIVKDFWNCDERPAVLEYLRENPTHIVFGEILRKGISPTRIENHEKVEFIVFDIARVMDLGKFKRQKVYRVDFLNYQIVHQQCFHFGMKCVRLFGEGRFTSMESLYAYRDEMLEICKKEGREGIVLKVFDDEGKPLYAKEKLDTATPRGHPKIEKGRPQYPPLPLSEAMGAVDKTYADLGQEFGNKTKAMPLVAKYIKEEMSKHQCSAPEYDFYRLYCDYCKDHGITVITEVTKVTTVTKVSIWKQIRERIKKWL